MADIEARIARARGGAVPPASSAARREPLEDPLRLRVIRKDIARLKTVLREKSRHRRASATVRRRAAAR